jgi:uncharacterized OB-fold protein
VTESKSIPFMTSRPLTYIHKIPILKTRLFWEKLKEGEIYATKCKKCGTVYYPPQADCPGCLASDVDWFKLRNEAILEAYTQVRAKPQGFDQYEPYIIALAATVDGIRVLGKLENAKLEDTKIGMKLKITTGVSKDGYMAITFKRSEE